MKVFFLTVIYIICFTFVSLVISQLPAFINGEDLFENDNETILSVIAGISSGLIVGFFNMKKTINEN